MRGCPCDGSLKSLLDLLLCHLPGNMEWKLQVQYCQQARTNIWSAHYNFLNRHFTVSTTKYTNRNWETSRSEGICQLRYRIDQTTLSLHSVVIVDLHQPPLAVDISRIPPLLSVIVWSLMVSPVPSPSSTTSTSTPERRGSVCIWR